VPWLGARFRDAAQLSAGPEEMSGASLSNGPRKRLKFESIREYQLHKKAFTAEIAEFAEKFLENLFCQRAASAVNHSLYRDPKNISAKIFKKRRK